MRLASIDSATFGTLNIQEPLLLDAGINMCIAPNQTGKSTLLTMLEWVLYGVPPRGRKRNQTEVDRWRPWTGGVPQARVTLHPERPGWPELVRIVVNFEEFTPHVTDAQMLEDLGERGLFTVEKTGEWDLGKQLTGLGREAFRSSLLAPQDEMDNILSDIELRRLLTADLADLVEDPERASLDSALAELDKPVFTMGELSKGPVQMGKLLREAQNHWQMSVGNLEHQQERYGQLESLLTQLENAEAELGEQLAALTRQERYLSQMSLAAAHWRHRQVDNLLAQAADWESRLDRDRWLADFPSGLQRDVDNWSADRRNLREQFVTAEAQAREADALRLRAPYVEHVRVDSAEDVVRLQERLKSIRNDIRARDEKLKQTADRLQEIDAYLERYKQIGDQVDHLNDLSERYLAMAAAAKDWHAANRLVHEYGEGRDAAERHRLEELEQVVKPYRGCVPQLADYIQWGAELAQRRSVLEGQREKLVSETRVSGRGMITGAIVAGVVGVLIAVFGGLVFQLAWVGILAGVLLLVLSAWLGFSGIKLSRAAIEARIELDKAVTPKLEEVSRLEDKRVRLAEQIKKEYDLAEATWTNLVGLLPEYQQLRLSLEQYGQALRDRDGARERRDQAWLKVRELCKDAPVETDDGWLSSRVRNLEGLRDQTKRRLDEYSKTRDDENARDKLRLDEADILRRLAVDLEPLGLGGKLRQDVDSAVKQFQLMVNETRTYTELRKNAAEMARLKVRKQDLTEKLARLLSPLGLAAMAADDPDAALREFEVRHGEAQRYAQFADRLREAREQVRHLNIEREDYLRRWEACSAETRREVEAAITDENSYDALMAKRREADENLAEQRRLREQKRGQVERLRQAVARDEDVRDELEQATLQEYQTGLQRKQVIRWHRALELLAAELQTLQQDLASNLAPRLTEELQAVLEQAPVRNVLQASLSSQLELQLAVRGAPAGLTGAELLERLSVGARRQLALALRIAVARALGEATRTVMLLDEPLAELDDARAVESLRFIGSLATEHQFIMTTCHSEHQNWLTQQSGITARTITLG